VQVQENEKGEDEEMGQEKSGRLLTPLRQKTFSTQHIAPLLRLRLPKTQPTITLGERRP